MLHSFLNPVPLPPLLQFRIRCAATVTHYPWYPDGTFERRQARVAHFDASPVLSRASNEYCIVIYPVLQSAYKCFSGPDGREGERQFFFDMPRSICDSVGLGLFPLLRGLPEISARSLP
jgi:hypothetical protein